jgi:hypothetical protein
MRLSIDLTQAWHRLVAAGAMRNTFVDAAGRKIEAGVRLGSGGPESYAIAVDTGLNACEAAELLRLDSGMEILYNPVGKLKPHTPPSKSGRQPDIPFDAATCPLACQNPDNPLSILRRPALAEIPCDNRHWRAYPNVAPWEARGILIWLPCPADGTLRTLPHLPQVRDQAGLEDFLAIARASSGIATFFNSLHGGASANHLHFQAVYCERRLAVESAHQESIDGWELLENYPAAGLAFALDSPSARVWEAIAKVQAAGYPFNLIALSTGVFLFVREPRNEILDEFPGRAFGAINFAGLFITSDPEERKHVNDQTIAAAYAKLTLDRTTLMEALRK